MVGAVDRLGDRQRPLQQRQRLVSPTQGSQHRRQVVQPDGDDGVVGAGAVDGLGDRQRPLEQRQRLVSPPQGSQRQRQVVQRGGDLGVVGAVDGLGDRQRPLEQRQRLVSPPQGSQRFCLVVQVAGDGGMVGAVDRLGDRQRPLEQRQRRTRLAVFTQVGRGPVTQPGQAVKGGVGIGMPEHGSDVRQINPPYRPGVRVPHDVFGQYLAEQPYQGAGPHLSYLTAHGASGRGLDQPVHIHRVPVTAGQAEPDQRPDRGRPTRPVTDRALQRPVIKPGRIREQTQRNLLRVA